MSLINQPIHEAGETVQQVGTNLEDHAKVGVLEILDAFFARLHRTKIVISFQEDDGQPK